MYSLLLWETAPDSLQSFEEEHMSEQPGASASLNKPDSDHVRLLVVGGIGRSGSTLMDRLLGQLPGHVSVGELAVSLWDRSLARDWPCGCGKPFRSCPFWTAVGEQAFDGWDKIDLAKVIRLQKAVNQTEKIPFLLAPGAKPGFREALTRYLDYMTRVYVAVRDVSGARVIVDSSKASSVPYLLRRAERLDVTVAQVVRDPRGVAFSWSKRKPNRAELGGDGEAGLMPMITPRKVARRWMTINGMIFALPRLGVPVIRLRYEDIVPRPAEELARVAEALGEDIGPDDMAFVRPKEVELKEAHTTHGNPNRFESGWVPLRLDEAWRQDLPTDSRRTVEIITAPLRGVYGYRH